MNFKNDYLFIKDMPPKLNLDDCPKCGEALSVNWKLGKPYCYCVEGCELTLNDFIKNKKSI